MGPVFQQHLAQQAPEELAVVKAEQPLEVVGADHREIRHSDLGDWSSIVS